MPNTSHNKAEIQESLRRSYARRLEPRAKLIRQLLFQRRWSELQDQLSLLKQTSREFGFPELVEPTEMIQGIFSEHRALSPATAPRGAYEATTQLLNTIDTVLGKNSWLH